MSNSDSLTSAEIDQLLERLSGVTPQSFEEQRAADAVIAALTRYKRFARQATGQSPQDTPPTANTKSGSVIPIGAMKSGPFLGQGLRAACVEAIRQAGRPQTAREVWSALSAGGFTSAHNDPVHAVQSALKRRAHVHKDVILVGGGKWDLTVNLTEEQIAGLANLGANAGRDAEAHRQKTLEGMRVAAERGATVGAKRKFTPEVAAEFKRLFDKGVSLKRACKMLGVTPNTFYNNREQFDRWTAGEQWPQTDSDDEGPDQSTRVVN